MTTLQDAKLATLQAQLATTGHVNDLELLWVQALGATSGSIVDGWWEVFDAAAIPPGQFNDRAVAYIVSVAGAPPSDDYNEHWRHYWLNATLGPAPPPAFANVQHWFDFTDLATVFSDQAGTVPSVLGGAIRHVVNKGLDGTPATTTDGDATTVTLLDSGIVVGGVERTIGQSLDSTHALTLNHALPGGASGAAFAMLVRAEQAMTAARTIFAWGGMGANMVGNAGGPDPAPWNFSISGGGFIVSAKPVVPFEWVSIIVSKDGGTQDYFSRVSGTPELNSSPSPYSPVTFPGPGMTIFSTGNDIVELGELIIWDRALTLAERDAATAYFDTKYGTLPFIDVPSTVAELIHHYDLSDPLTVFRNTAGTQAAGEGDPIRLLLDKGTQISDLQSAGGGDQAPVYRESFLGGQNVGEFAPSANNRSLLGTDGPGLATSTTGISAALVFQIDQAIGGAVTVAAWGSAPNGFRGGREFGAGQFGWDMPGASSVFSLTPHVVGGWYLWYVSRPAGVGNAIYQKSGEAQQSTLLGAMLDILAGQSIGLTHITSQDFRIAEWVVWDGPLSLTELTELVNEIDVKYGTMPVLPPPPVPAPGNLLHHVDASDASTVWADAAATIPATNGATVERIDNKGTRGTPLLRVGFGPVTYLTGVLNGLNVIEFQSANGQLTITAESPGLAISATGFTSALITRRRGTVAVGNPILWRWSPAAGTPGPSLRLKGGTQDLAADVTGNPEEILIGASGLDTWYLIYISVDPVGADDAKYGSPGPEVVTPFGVPTDIPDLADVRWGTSNITMENVEAFFWDRPLTAAERAQLIAYADAKYGTLPHT
jgi:hypothetical protein